MERKSSFRPITEDRLRKMMDFSPIEKLGQHFLVDTDMVNRLVNTTMLGSDVVEIGCGPGNLTQGIAERAGRVIGLEIFPGFLEAQQHILRNCNNVEIINQNVLSFNFKKWINNDPEMRHQIIGNIPFHISEPLLFQIVHVADNIDNITLLIGDNLAKTMTSTNPYDDYYSRLSFVAEIFDIEHLAHVTRKCFWPVPRTDADLISLVPKEYPLDGRMISFQLKKKIVLSQVDNLTLAKVLKGFSYKKEDKKILGKEMSNRYDRRQTRSDLRRMRVDLNDMPINKREILMDSMDKNYSIVSRIGLSNDILSKPFGRLNNDEVRKLAIAINRL